MNMQKPRVRSTRVYDCVGIGFGPSNIALAIALEERGLLGNCLFLEAQPDFKWHPGMLIEGTDIQHNPLRDFVTPRNPRSKYGFLSYLKAQGRLFDYLNLAASFPPRSEYAGYVNWVASHFRDKVRLNTRASEISFSAKGDLVEIRTDNRGAERIFARSIVFGPGRSELVPREFEDLLGDDVVHLTQYLPAKERWCAKHKRPRVCVLGGSQSAIEIVLDLADCADVTNVSRGFGFKQKDLSAFTECIYYPGFVDYFFGAGTQSQNAMMHELWRSNYGAADPDVIEALNFRLYEQKVRNTQSIRILQNTAVRNVTPLGEGRGYALTLKEKHSGDAQDVVVDGIVLATGFRNFGDAEGQEPFHPLLENIVAANARIRGDGGIDIGRDYRLQFEDTAARPAVFINGLCEASHGFGDAGSFSLLSVRSDEIAQSLEAYVSTLPNIQLEEPLYAE